MVKVLLDDFHFVYGGKSFFLLKLNHNLMTELMSERL